MNAGVVERRLAATFGGAVGLRSAGAVRVVIAAKSYLAAQARWAPSPRAVAAAAIAGNFLIEELVADDGQPDRRERDQVAAAGLGYGYRSAASKGGWGWSSSITRSIKALSANGSPLYSVFHVTTGGCGDAAHQGVLGITRADWKDHGRRLGGPVSSSRIADTLVRMVDIRDSTRPAYPDVPGDHYEPDTEVVFRLVDDE